VHEPCEAKQVGASIVCRRCNVHWDANDPGQKPECLSDDQVKAVLRSRRQGPDPVYVPTTLAMIEAAAGGLLPPDTVLSGSEDGLQVTLPDGRVFDFDDWVEGEWPQDTPEQE